CPVCGKEFDENKKNEIIANFNKNKAEKLAEIERQANSIKININSAEDSIKEIKKEVDKINADIISKRQQLDLLGEFTETRKEPKIKQLPDEYKEHEKAIEKIKKELKSIASVDNSRLKDLKENYKRDLEQMIQKLAKKDLNAEIDKKVKLYEKTEKDLAKEYENNQRIVYLTEEYIKIYTDLVQDKINEMFKDVKFKLFDTQVNGGIVETCEATVNGVPYSDVNNAGKINAGLDIINTISKKLDASVPIFVDNAESVNKIIDTDGQIVKLFVSDDKELVVKGE
ncbi:MAG: recombinase RecF, partial [Anaerococcus obesiensis]